MPIQGARPKIIPCIAKNSKDISGSISEYNVRQLVKTGGFSTETALNSYKPHRVTVKRDGIV